ncbi:hypothetical protein DH2020_033263 [Rehmannia glutinosa]|uniref:mRNA cap guanine-N(7) methyltransferase n=1 Tax=Rehmannia glutinosa TaxID=99300 RepID=A0ABR0VG32_REHGL
MKRGYQESSSSGSFGPPHSKFKYNPEGDAQFLEDDNTKIFAKKVADHYSARTNQTLEEREASPIIHLKKLNNWIKSVLIQLYAKRGDAVLDLACGKGGDLIKWDKARIGYYVGIDIADGSLCVVLAPSPKKCMQEPLVILRIDLYRFNCLKYHIEALHELHLSFQISDIELPMAIEDCRTRYNGDADHHQRRKKVRLDKVLAEDAPFDVCSCQFAMHYSWSTEARARRALANVSALLGQEASSLEQCQMPTSSSKSLEKDAVDCPEWIVPFHVFKTLAEEYGLELVFVKNSHVFVDEYMKKPEFVELMRRLGALGDGKEDQSTLSPDEWEVAYLYLAFVLRKVES